MAVTLRDAQVDDRDQLQRLLADYLFEFDGSTEPYPYLDALPFWLTVGFNELEGPDTGATVTRREL